MTVGRVLVLILFASLCSCDVDLFGLDQKQLAGGYKLTLTENDSACALVPPGGNGGLLVKEVGWKEPLLLVDYYNDRWGIIDTTTKKEILISDAERKSDPRFRDIQSYPARDVWEELKRHKRLW